LAKHIKKTHGGLDYSRLKERGLNPDEIIDFSVSINPYPVHESIMKAVRNCSLIRYPDSTAFDLREKIAEREKCSAHEILAVNGTSQGIHLIGEAFLNEKTTTLIAAPAYSQYKNISRLMKSTVIEMKSTPATDFNHSASEIIESIRKYKPKIIWLCNPNNPTGTYIDNIKMKSIEKAAIESGTIVVLDEAYVAFTREELRFRDISSNILRLNSMTKDYGIPGLRLGYIHGDRELLKTISDFQPEWSISAPAQQAGIACLDEKDYYAGTWRAVKEECERFRKELGLLGLKVLETESNFFMLRLGNRENLSEETGYASLLQAELDNKMMQIRDCSSFGYPDYIRIGVLSRENNDKLLQAISETAYIWE
jgi:histidinol-phosphate aminotransferase